MYSKFQYIVKAKCIINGKIIHESTRKIMFKIHDTYTKKLYNLFIHEYTGCPESSTGYFNLMLIEESLMNFNEILFFDNLSL